MIESEICISSPIIVLKDCRVLGRAVWSGKPNEYRCHSAPSRRTPNFVRGVNTTWRSESISSKSLTLLPPRSTLPSSTYVASAENSPETGQKPLLSWQNPVLAKKISAAKMKARDRKPDIFIRSPAPASTAKESNSLRNILHHH